MELLAPSDYSARLTGAVAALPAVDVAVTDCLGLVLAEPVIARASLPGFDNSAMDGYAVRAQDVPDAGTVLPVAGVVPAGDTRRNRLEPGTAWQIMTGAPVPDGADTVVQVELTDGGTDEVRFERAAEPGVSIRRAGEDVSAGDEVLAAGTRIAARHVPVLVAAGSATVRVIPRPKVAVISTGDELRSVGDELAYGQIIDTNAPMLAALARQAGFEVVHIGRSGDTAEAVLAAVEQASDAGADAIITTGGVSAGAFEPLKAAFEGGSEITFSKVAMQPGKPQGFGIIGDRMPLFALPGNPVSSLVSFVMFVAPALRTMAGRTTDIAWLSARVTKGWRTSPGRAQIARVRLSQNDHGLGVAPSGGPGSHLMGGLAHADALAWIDASVDEVTAGDEVRVVSLEGEFA